MTKNSFFKKKKKNAKKKTNKKKKKKLASACLSSTMRKPTFLDPFNCILPFLVILPTIGDNHFSRFPIKWTTST
jgi:hypothetical protein